MSISKQTAKEGIAILEEAEHKIDSLKRKLDNTAQECECCGCNRYNDWDEHLVHESLSSAQTRMSSAAAKLRLVLKDG